MVVAASGERSGKCWWAIGREQFSSHASLLASTRVALHMQSTLLLGVAVFVVMLPRGDEATTGKASRAGQEFEDRPTRCG
jgi:hypothetical protein